MPDHALELSFDEASAQAVTMQWEALQTAGLASQADHRSMTNAPHLTLVAAVGIDPEVVPVTVAMVQPLLPAAIHLSGLVLLGTGPRVSIAHLAEPGAALAAVVAELRARVPNVRHVTWTPHVTLARRVPRRLLPAALEVLGGTPSPRVLVADRLRWWDPDADLIMDVARAGG
ncbi:2'-5' RNA ligase family protein [Nocardioides gilvus]|uniref:2'-5' RNA ligase family protein n=1 Tax=Nocardioides gilvus TaxID=1735589 RepID=UPI000D74CE49|nr:2'-5' RNA ligase family protein [Nocardioides gilvus]